MKREAGGPAGLRTWPPSSLVTKSAALIMPLPHCGSISSIPFRGQPGRIKIINAMRIAPLISLSVGLFIGCGSAAPLSITLYNPKTSVSRTCAARSTIKTDVEFLSRTVEACAKQLESHGFVRVDSVPVEETPRPERSTYPSATMP